MTRISLEEAIKITERAWDEKLDKYGLPSDGMIRYIVHRIEPGHFLTKLLENDLVGAFARADDQNSHRMKQWASFLYNEMPVRSMKHMWGSPEIVKEWLENKDGTV